MTKRGQGLVEFALIMPLLLLLIMGVIDFGWMVFNYIQLNNSLRETLRYGSVSGLTSTDQTKDCATLYKTFRSMAPYSGVQNNNITVYYDKGYSSGQDDTKNIIGKCTLPGPFSGTLKNGQRLVVQATVSVKFLTPLFWSWLPDGLTLSFRGARTIYPDKGAS